MIELEERLNDTAPIPTMDGNQFDVKTRKCINYCLQNNVSHESASGIVDYVVKEMTGKTLQRLPKPTTNANIAREFGELSNIQCGEALVQEQTKNVTLGFDGTTKGGKKINELHAVTAEGSLTVSIDQIPGGKQLIVLNIYEKAYLMSQQLTLSIPKQTMQIQARRFMMVCQTFVKCATVP